jgi:hypothetical protein
MLSAFRHSAGIVKNRLVNNRILELWKLAGMQPVHQMYGNAAAAGSYYFEVAGLQLSTHVCTLHGGDYADWQLCWHNRCDLFVCDYTCLLALALYRLCAFMLVF